MSDAMKRVSVSLQELATNVEDFLHMQAGKMVAFVMLVSVDDSVQYIANCAREDGKLLLETQLEHWTRGRADIPGHYNPDLREQRK